ncbi:hypothetical protein [Denitratimonas sp. CY0512]|uniref:hypothetical protein n=1 Tax=Denitratimonas sp. CY0512 TaxID=3131940 RepID=UPI0030B2BD8D
MIRRLILISAVTVLLAACGASTPERPGSKLAPEEAVAQRAQERWDAIIAKDYARAYEYLTPGTRATTPYEGYARRLLGGVAIRWTKADVDRVECTEPGVCEAKVYITYLVRPAQMGTGNLEGYSPVYEKWLRSDDGQWHHLPSTTGR